MRKVLTKAQFAYVGFTPHSSATKSKYNLASDLANFLSESKKIPFRLNAPRDWLDIIAPFSEPVCTRFPVFSPSNMAQICYAF